MIEQYSTQDTSVASHWHKLPVSQKLLSVSLSLFVFVLPVLTIVNGYSTEFRNRASVADGTVVVLLETPPEGITADVDTDLIVKVNTQGTNISKLHLNFQGVTQMNGFDLPTFTISNTLPVSLDPSSQISLVGNPYPNGFNANLVFTESTAGSGFSSTSFTEVGRLHLKVHAMSFDSRLDVTVDNNNSFANAVGSSADILKLTNPIYSFSILPNPDRCLNAMQYKTQYCPDGKNVSEIFDQKLQCYIYVCNPQSTGEPNPIDWNFGDKFHFRTSNLTLQIDGVNLFINPSSVFYSISEHVGTGTWGSQQWTGLLRSVSIYWIENGVPYRWYLQLVQNQQTLKWEMIYSNVEKYQYKPSGNADYSVYFETFSPDIFQNTNASIPPDLSFHVLANAGNHDGTMTLNKVMISADTDPFPPLTPTPTTIPTSTVEPTAIPSDTPQPTALPTLTTAPTNTPAVTDGPTATPVTCNVRPAGRQADFNTDDKVNLTDYLLLAHDFLKTGIVLQADANCDGKVNIDDYSILVLEFLK